MISLKSQSSFVISRSHLPPSNIFAVWSVNKIIVKVNSKSHTWYIQVYDIKIMLNTIWMLFCSVPASDGLLYYSPRCTLYYSTLTFLSLYSFVYRDITIWMNFFMWEVRQYSINHLWFTFGFSSKNSIANLFSWY